MRLQYALIILSILTTESVARAVTGVLRGRVYRAREQPGQHRHHTPSSAPFFDVKVGAGKNALDSTTPAVRYRGGSCDARPSKGGRWRTVGEGSSAVIARSSRGGPRGWGQLLRRYPANASSATADFRIREPSCVIGLVPSLSGRAITYRWRSLPRIRRHRASSPQGGGGGKANSQVECPQQAYRAALLRTCLLFVCAGAFGLGTMAIKGKKASLEFFTGYIVEQSLSVDNLFIFIMLFDYFKVPEEFQPRVLKWGIIGAMSMRAIMIVVGVAAIQRFRWIMLFFAGILVASSLNLLMEGEEDHTDSSHLENNTVLKIANWLCDSVDYYDGEKFFTLVDGVKKATPLLLCLICIELSDFVFAVDSIPAVLGISHDTFIVYASNVFAICAMRSIYTLVSHAIADLPYLKPAVAFVLGFVGAKMCAEFFHYKVDVGLSLGVVSGILAAGAIASVISNRRRDSAAAAVISGGGSEGLTFKAMAILEEAQKSSTASVNHSDAQNATPKLEFEQQRQHQTNSGESLFAQSSAAVAWEVGEGGQAAEEVYFSKVEQSPMRPSEGFAGELAAAELQGVATSGVLEGDDLAQEGVGGIEHNVEAGLEASSEVAAVSSADAIPVFESDGEDAIARVDVPKGSDVAGHGGLDDEVNVEETAPLRGGWEEHDVERGVDEATRESQETGM